MVKEQDKSLTLANRRYLGNKQSICPFIKEVISTLKPIEVIADIFSGTGVFSASFLDKTLITNDILYSNYITHCAYFLPLEYNENKIYEKLDFYNDPLFLKNKESSNYMSEYFSNTYFSAKNCLLIGEIRKDIEQSYLKKELNFKEYTLLLSALLFGIDRIANTVGHYDAYRKNVKDLDKKVLKLVPLIAPKILKDNVCYNLDANILIEKIECDLLYLDPPYNSRQYSSTYHLWENIALFKKQIPQGVAKKIPLEHLKSKYCTKNAPLVFKDLISKARAKYILLSYNNMGNKGNSRSNAKISDENILGILKQKGKVEIFETPYKHFDTGKSKITNHKERLFLCEVR